VAASISPTDVRLGDNINITFTVKNTSNKTLETMGPEPGFTYVQGESYTMQKFASEPAKWRVGIATAGLESVDLQYRWGLGAPLAPGATTTVTDHIRVSQWFESTNFWAAIVEEPSDVVQSGVGMTLITSPSEPRAILVVDAADVRSDASMDARVLEQIKYGIDLQVIGISRGADWLKIKLPDHSEGWVAANAVSQHPQR
jgi:hypothetical protein